MRPDWFRCGTCLFGTSDSTFICHVNSESKSKSPTDFCKEWTCANCWNPWDTCDYPDTGDAWVGVYHDHNTCETVKFRGE